MKKLLLVFVAAIALFVGCKIDQAGVPVPSSNTAINGIWYLKTKITDNFVADTAQTPDTVKAFTKNDFYTFNADNTVIFASSANTTDQKAYYSLTTTASGQTLTIGVPAGPGTPYAVNKLSKDSLILFTSATTTLSGVPTTVNITSFFTH